MRHALPILSGLLLTTIVVGGCRTTGRPQWFHPGNAWRQQERAAQYDPYPQTDNFGGDMSGTRPLDYDRPIPETSRARWIKGGGENSLRYGY